MYFPLNQTNIVLVGKPSTHTFYKTTWINRRYGHMQFFLRFGSVI